MEALKPFAQEDKHKSWFHLITTLLTLILLEVSVFFTPYTIPNLLLSVLLSLIFVRLFSIYHDVMHQAIFKKHILVIFFMKLYGLLVLNPPSIWRRSHDHHHKNNSKVYASDIGSYPIVTKKEYQNFSRKEKVKYTLIRSPFTIFFGYFFIFMVGMCFMSFIKKPTKHWDSLLALVLHFTILYLGIHYQSHFLLYGFWLPLFISSLLGAYLFYVQHNFPQMQLLPNTEWDFFFAALYSTSYFKMSRVLHWFTGNIGYHHIHHLNAQIPFYNLPKAFKNIKTLQQVAVVEWSVSSIIACLRLHYWDNDENKMKNYF